MYVEYWRLNGLISNRRLHCSLAGLSVWILRVNTVFLPPENGVRGFSWFLLYEQANEFSGKRLPDCLLLTITYICYYFIATENALPRRHIILVIDHTCFKILKLKFSLVVSLLLVWRLVKSKIEPRHEKKCLLGIQEQQRSRSPNKQNYKNWKRPFFYILIYSAVSNVNVSGQRCPRSDCASAQSDLGLRCPYKPKRHFRMTWREYFLSLNSNGQTQGTCNSSSSGTRFLE